MSFGIIEVITLLLGLAGFGVQVNPKPPTADQALQYAIADADFAAHLDAVSIVPGNYKLLAQLADQPQIRASSELQKLVRKAIGEVEGARGAAKMATGVDVTTDIADATAFFQVVPQEEPRFVVAVRGKFSSANLDKIARLVNKPLTRTDAGQLVELGATQPAVGLTRDGVVLVGTADLVRERLTSTWKAPSHDAGTNLGYLAEAINGRPVFAAMMAMSTAARTEALRHLAPQGFATDIVKRHRAATFAVFHDGLGWTWVDSTREGLDDIELMSKGVLELLRAGQLAPRGLAKIAMSIAGSYRGASSELDDLISRKADVMKIVDSYTGDGSFKVAIDKNPRTMRFTVRATGKSVSEVFPGVIVPIAIVGFVQAQAKDAVPQAAPPTPTPAPAPPTWATPPAAKPAPNKPAVPPPNPR
ncbi:MAG TPA: hypothetical protein VLM79_01010 [Kofleriaceae bacterium]|nr:hypothetical protein [Kofleriaceae bacterium]